jgi:CRISPR-associated endonuclease Csn1
LEAQRFRLLQKVNDLEIIYPGQVLGAPITDAQRLSLYELLDTQGDQKFEAIRKHLGLEKNIGFNLQRGGETKLRGNLVNKIMGKAFAARWEEMDEEQKRLAVDEWRTIESEQSLCRRFVEHWGLDDMAASGLAEQTPPKGHCQLSRKAIRRLLPLMFLGKRFMAARQEIPEYRPQLQTPMNRIPPVREALATLRNPAIERSLTELRKVVNAMVREYGKPAEVRVELARELKKSRTVRQTITKGVRQNEDKRRAAAKKILDECGLKMEPRDRGIEKALLWIDQDGVCPYTGDKYEFSRLFGEHDPYEIDHIIPRSRIPDDSYRNRVLCARSANQWKKNKTPREAFPDDAEFDKVLERVARWPVKNREKMERFQLSRMEDIEDFSERRLRDTSYATTQACTLISKLYGGLTVNGRMVVTTSSGMVTASLRRRWGLQGILGRRSALPTETPGKGKNRDDHRHHAVDAITIALTPQSMIQFMNRISAANPGWDWDKWNERSLPGLWSNFNENIETVVADILVSHRPEHRLSGELHKATNYAWRRAWGKEVRVRRAVKDLKPAQVKEIADRAVREAVEEKAKELGGNLGLCNPSEGVENWPMLRTKTGKLIPIKRVRVREATTAQAVAPDSPRERHVAADSVHHVAVFVTKDQKGRDKWISDIVTVYEAAQRLEEQRRQVRLGRPAEPIVRGTHSIDREAQFLFCLMKKDTLRITVDGQRCIYLVTSFEADGRASLIPINAAGKRTEQRGSNVMIREALSSLKERCPEKVLVDTLGRALSVRDKVSMKP